MMARSISKLIQLSYRLIQFGETYLELTIKHFNSTFNDSDDSNTFWARVIADMENRFPSSQKYSIDMRKQISTSQLFVRLSQRLGVKWKKEIYELVDKSPSIQFRNEDLITIVPYFHNLKVASCIPILKMVETSEAVEQSLQRQLAMNSEVGSLSSAFTLQSLAEQRIYKGQYQSALEMLQILAKQIEKLRDPNHADVATVNHHLGKLYLIMGDYKKSEEHLSKALKIRETNSKKKEFIAVVLISIAQLNKTLGKFDVVESLTRRAITIYKEVLGQYHPDSDLQSSG